MGSDHLIRSVLTTVFLNDEEEYEGGIVLEQIWNRSFGIKFTPDGRSSYLVAEVCIWRRKVAVLGSVEI